MNDEQMQPLLKTWLRARKVAPTDVSNGVAQVVARLPEVPQRDRWWPLPRLHRKAQTSTATNGHATTVSGRTQTMFSATKFVAVAAVLTLAGTLLWSGVLTPPPEQQTPGAEAERTDFIIVTGTSTLSGGGAPTGDDSMSDPRVSGRVQLINNYKMSTEDATGVQWGPYTLTNESGGWEGEWIGFYAGAAADVYDQPGEENAMVWASGTGDYEGWSYVANYAGNLFELDVKGLMYQDLIPPTVVLGLLEAEAE